MTIRSSVLAAGVTLPILGTFMMSGTHPGSGQFFPMTAFYDLNFVGSGDIAALLPAQTRKSRRETTDPSGDSTEAIDLAVARRMGIAGREARDHRHAQRLAVLDERLRSAQTDFSTDPEQRQYRRSRRLGTS